MATTQKTKEQTALEAAQAKLQAHETRITDEEGGIYEPEDLKKRDDLQEAVAKAQVAVDASQAEDTERTAKVKEVNAAMTSAFHKWIQKNGLEDGHKNVNANTIINAKLDEMIARGTYPADPKDGEKWVIAELVSLQSEGKFGKTPEQLSKEAEDKNPNDPKDGDTPTTGSKTDNDDLAAKAERDAISMQDPRVALHDGDDVTKDILDSAFLRVGSDFGPDATGGNMPQGNNSGGGDKDGDADGDNGEGEGN